jgi:hypothetical protein
MIEPPPDFLMSGIACFVQRKTPFRFTSIT